MSLATLTNNITKLFDLNKFTIVKENYDELLQKIVKDYSYDFYEIITLMVKLDEN